MSGYDSDSVEYTSDDSDTSNDSDTNDTNILELLRESDRSATAICERDASSDEPHDHQDVPSNEPELDVSLPPPDIQSEVANPSSSPLVVIDPFPHGSPGALIPQGSHMDHTDHEASNNLVWTPFASQYEWEIAYWSKMQGPTSSATAELLAIPEVCLFFLGFGLLLTHNGRLFRGSNCLTAQLWN